MEIDVHTDPDAQATVNDFLDYTEYLSSDLARCCTLLGQENTKAESRLTEVGKLLPPSHEASATVDDNALCYPDLLNLCLANSESNYAEAERINDEISRHLQKIVSINNKLHQLPKPPSRDPTPAPVDVDGAKERGDNTARTGLKLHFKTSLLESAQQPQPPRRRTGYRRIIVPGEVLPPPNPDSPSPSSSSESESDEPATPPPRVRDISRSGQARHIRIRPPKEPKAQKARRTTPKPRKERPPGYIGTNVHSSVAGISTSNALALLTPPPEDAKPGSKHKPWLRLTEFEMAKLRKRMKKNAIWAPSETMIKRELAESGRGEANYKRARAASEVNGTELLDEDDIPSLDPGRPLRMGEIRIDLGQNGSSNNIIENKGMRLNEQKKKKREAQANLEQAAASFSAKTVVANLSKLQMSMANLFNSTLTTPTESNGKESKKRKRESDTGTGSSQPTPTMLSSTLFPTRPAALAKTMSASSTFTQGASKDTATPTATSPTVQSRRTAALATASSSRPHRRGVSIKPPANPTGSPETRDPEPRTSTTSRPSSRRASQGPADGGIDRSHLRRKSATPAPAATQPATITATRLRAKKPAPGPVTSSQDGGAAVSVSGKRKTAPSRKRNREEEKGEENAGDEAVDPNEPTYCLCNDVSYGTMVACENENCEREWFHLACVGLQDSPPRRTKWWCPMCKDKGLDKKA